MNQIEVEFHGAAGEVTGSNHLLRIGRRRFLLDCGAIQGSREAEERNAAGFAYAAGSIDAVLLSHAHIDHCGRLPLLHKAGFRGPIYTQRATADLVPIMLADSARLAEADAVYESRKRARRGLPPVEPVYDSDDAAAACGLLRGVDYDHWLDLGDGVRARWREAGHILGSAAIEIEALGRTIVFSGDIGPLGTPLLRDPQPPPRADLVLMESTYGDRMHRSREATIAELGEVIDEAARSGGNVLVPAFAVGRSQELMYWLMENFDAFGIDRFRICLDSPMAIKVSKLYSRHHALWDEGARARHAQHLAFDQLPNLELIEKGEDSAALNSVSRGLIVIAGSGMCNGGRIKHHLKHNLSRPAAHVVFTGYQAGGTLGRLLVDGAREVSIYGDRVPVRAKIHTIGGLSAHADQGGLLDWLRPIEGQPEVWLVHGEDRARNALAERIRGELKLKVELPTPKSRALLAGRD